jgi:NTE family protein
MAIYEMVETAGGVKPFMQQTGGKTGKQILIIVVDAATHSRHSIDASNQVPSIEDTINAMTDVQLHRYNAATLDLMREEFAKWAQDLSTPNRPVLPPYFVHLGLNSLTSERRTYFDKIPTNFSLTDEQVDNLILLGRELIHSNAQFQRFIKENHHPSYN